MIILYFSIYLSYIHDLLFGFDENKFSSSESGVCYGTGCIIVILVFFFYHCVLFFSIICSSIWFTLYDYQITLLLILAPLGRLCRVTLLFVICSSLSPYYVYLNFLYLSQGSFGNSLSSSLKANEALSLSTKQSEAKWQLATTMPWSDAIVKRLMICFSKHFPPLCNCCDSR